MLKLADSDVEETIIVAAAAAADAANNCDEIGTKVQQSVHDSQIYDHETPSDYDHDMNYEICDMNPAEQSVSKQSQPYRFITRLAPGHDGINTAVIDQNATIENTENQNDDNVSTAANQKTSTPQKPVPAPRNLFFTAGANKSSVQEDNFQTDVSVRERAKTFSFVETCQIPPTPFR